MFTKEMLISKSIENENGCLVWQRGRNSYGYGIVYDKGNSKQFAAHRVMMQLELETDIAGHHVLHTCDNPSCINPNHLKLGSHKDNMADKKEKGRQCKGFDHGSCVVTPEQVDIILSDKRSTRKIANMLGISHGTVHRVRTMPSKYDR